MSEFDFSAATDRATSGLTDPASRIAARREAISRELTATIDRLGWRRLEKAAPPRPGKPGRGRAIAYTIRDKAKTLASRPREASRHFVVGISPWSLPDLETLDLVAEIRGVRDREIRVSLFTLDDCRTYDDLQGFAPGIHPIAQSPILVEYDEGQIVRALEGREVANWCREVLRREPAEV